MKKRTGSNWEEKYSKDQRNMPPATASVHSSTASSGENSTKAENEGRLIGAVGKIQNLSSSVGFITRTLEGKIELSEKSGVRRKSP